MSTLRNRIPRIASRISAFGYCTIAAAISCLIAFTPLGWHELLAAGVTISMLLLAGMLCSLAPMPHHANIEVTPRRLRIAQTCHIRITITNTTNRRTMRAHGALVIASHTHHLRIPSLPARHTHHITIACTAASRGSVLIGPLHIIQGDPWGLVRQHAHCHDTANVIVHPTIADLTTTMPQHTRNLDGTPSGVMTHDDFDCLDIRPYTLGDDLRHVHWKHTARRGTLMLRRYDAHKHAFASISLDANRSHYRTSEEFELAVSAYASISAYCLRHGITIAAHDGTFSSMPSSIISLLDACSSITPHDDPPATNLALPYERNANTHFFVIGSQHSDDNLRQLARTAPDGHVTIIVQTSTTLPQLHTVCGQVTLLRIPSLAALTTSLTTILTKA